MCKEMQRREMQITVSIIDSGSKAPAYNNDAIICLYRQF